jgi:hypothetical protein
MIEAGALIQTNKLSFVQYSQNFSCVFREIFKELYSEGLPHVINRHKLTIMLLYLKGMSFLLFQLPRVYYTFLKIAKHD